MFNVSVVLMGSSKKKILTILEFQHMEAMYFAHWAI
jgi:hypothetical protein